MKEYSDEAKIKFLDSLIRACYIQGDSYHIRRNRTGSWTFGYSNDYPLQHGGGSEITLPDSMVNILMNRSNIK